MDGKRSSRIEALRQPPFSLESEQAVLGGLMLNEAALAKVSDWLTEEDFFRKDHRLIYKAILELAGQGKPYDSVTLGEWFEANGIADLVDGSNYILRLANNTPSAANIVAYAEIVQHKSRLRQLIDAGTEIAGQAFDPKADASLIASQATNKLAAMTTSARAGGHRSIKGSVGSWYARLHERFERREEYSGLLTPWEKLNDLTLGLQAGDLIIIAGRSNMGKSVAGFQIATHSALAGYHTALQSLEMRDEAFVQRSVAAIAKISHRSLRRPTDIDESEWPKISETMTRLAAAPLAIDDQAGLTVNQVCARLKRQHLRSSLKLAVVDHLHAIRRPGRDPVNEIADVAQQLKNTAKELNVPIVLLCQMNRSSHGRADHRPTMADLRGSGSIEEIGDVIFFLHREDYYDKTTHMKGVVEMIVGKGRDMPTGDTIYLANRFDQMRLDEWDGPLPTKHEAKESKPAGFKKQPKPDPRSPE